MDIQKEQWMKDTMQRYARPLEQMACDILRDRDMAKDVVQDTFLRLWKKDIEELRDKLAPWLWVVCRNQSLKRLRKEKRYVPLDPETEPTGPHVSEITSPAEEMDLKEQLGILAAARKKLSKKYNKVLFLRYNEGLSYEEIGTKTGLNPGNIGFILNEAKRKLRTDITGTTKRKSISLAKAE